MPIFTAKQRANLTVEERQRVGELVSDFVREIITPEGKKELEALKVKMGPRDLEPF